MTAPIVNMLSSTAQTSIHNLDTNSDFICGIYVGILLCLLAIALGHLLFYLFGK